MMSAADMRELIMLISDLRAKDTEKFEAHVRLMNEVVDAIREIASNVQTQSKNIEKGLNALKSTITQSLDSLMFTLNPAGIRETTKTLDKIMTSVNRSIQGMNLDVAMNQIRFLTGGISTKLLAEKENEAEVLKSPGASGVSAGGEEGEVGFVPESYKKKQAEKQNRQDVMQKPSKLLKK